MKYRYHWLCKLSALVLAFISGAALVLGAAGLALDDLGWYESIRWNQAGSEIWNFSHRAAQAVFDNYAWKDTGIEPELFERFFRWGADVDAVDTLEHDFHYRIYNSRGEITAGTFTGDRDWAWSDAYEFDVRRGFVTEMPKAEYYPGFDQYRTAADGMVYTDLTGQALPPLGEGVTDCEYYVVSEDDSVNRQNDSMPIYSHANANGADYTIYRLEYTGNETCQVEIYLSEEQKAAISSIDPATEFLSRFLKEHHGVLGPMAIWGGVFLLTAVLWLALIAGRSPEREGIRPGGLNCIPLDIWLAGAVIGCIGVGILIFEWLDSMIWNSAWGSYDGIGGTEYFYLEAGLLALCGGAAGELLTLFFMACAAQMKAGDGYWLKHTAVCLCWRCGWKYAKMAVRWCLDLLKKLLGRILGIFRAIRSIFSRLVGLLPLCWQWLLVSGGLWVLMFFSLLLGLFGYHPLLMLFGVCVTVLAVLYGAYGFGCLRDAAKKMSGGSLSEKIENKYLLGCFEEFAGHLNALGDVCVESARRQMKSERMKSELITNVSHDIKTPLTSIINYVDLLQKTEDEQARREYLEVLDRQSQQLKKLIEDLMEMSRASSGNVAVEITPTDVCEAVNQALGEFADKLDAQGLTVMLRAPDEPLMALCDGRHLWRVLSNVLSNAVKYAMPGTRVYVDVLARDGKAEIDLKNISAQMLNVSAEELMERFVRGDASRNTEGNGLGLNIARSLMELQGGALELVVDGDLFKVVLTLPAASGTCS